MAVVSVCVARYQFIHCICMCHGCSGPIEDSHFHQYGYVTLNSWMRSLQQPPAELIADINTY